MGKGRLVTFLTNINKVQNGRIENTRELAEFKKLVENLDPSFLRTLPMGKMGFGLTGGKWFTKWGAGDFVARLAKKLKLGEVKGKFDQVITKLKQLENGVWLPLMTKVLGDSLSRQRRQRRETGGL